MDLRKKERTWKDCLSHEGTEFVNEYSMYMCSLLVSEYARFAKTSLSQRPAQVYILLQYESF